MSDSMTSAERMRAAIQSEAVDHVPCSFMIYLALHDRCADPAEFVERQLAMGLDPYAYVGYLRPSLHPDATEKVWTESANGQTVFHRRIDTPAGPLQQTVAQVEGWPREDSFWLYNDLIVPRSKEFLVKPEQDLAKLPYLLGPTRDEDIRVLRDSARHTAKLADRHGVLQTGGWSSSYSSEIGDDGIMGADTMAWLSGYVDVMTLSLIDPDVIREYLRIIHEWNRRRMEIYLEVTRADLIIRRAWYETTEFWTPAAYRELIKPFLAEEVRLVHAAGKWFGLIVTSAFAPLLDDMLDTGIDVLIGLDPEEGKGTDLATVKRNCRARSCAIWGGVSGAVTVEQGSAEETRQAVTAAMQTLAPGGGFILSPVDNVREDTPNARRNTDIFIETWKQLRG